VAELREVAIPDLGDVEEVDVVEVLVAVGDQVGHDDSLISLESDKATMDVPAPFAGTVREVKVKAGDKVREGSVILMLEEEASGSGEVPAKNEPLGDKSVPLAVEIEETKEPAAVGEAPETASATPPSSHEQGGAEPSAAATTPPVAPPARPPARPVDVSKVYASPAVRRLARELGADLTRVRGTGRKARILKEDVERFVKDG
jgi:pyruvate dehydrogenase E2 component (dihydrolipoamide acetyltransferase)